MQIIHTSKIFGTIFQIGDEDIYIDFDMQIKNKTFTSYWTEVKENSEEKHENVYNVHIATCTKKLTLIAGKKGNGTVDIVYARRNTNQNECIVGVYSKLDTHQRKGIKFHLTVTIHQLKESLGDLFS